MTQVVANPRRITLSGLDDAGRSVLFIDARPANVGHAGEAAFRDRLPRRDESEVVAGA